MRRRLRHFPARRLARRAEVGEAVVAALPTTLAHPGRLAPLRTHWVLPVVAPDPDAVVAAMRERGFDAARGTSSIAVVDPPVGRDDADPRMAREMMHRIVFVPAPPQLSSRQRARLVDAFHAAAPPAPTTQAPSAARALEVVR